MFYPSNKLIIFASTDCSFVKMKSYRLNPNLVLHLCAAGPTLKSCLFPVHQPGEIKNSQKPPKVTNFFLQSLCLKRYSTKRFKKISS